MRDAPPATLDTTTDRAPAAVFATALADAHPIGTGAA
jgi:hypothetical protein